MFPDYSSTWEGRSTAYSIFVTCSLMRCLSNALCDVTQSLKLRKSSKETARCKDHPSQSFRTPRNEDSQNLKSLSTSESPKTILSTCDADNASCQAKKHRACLQSPGIPSLVHSLVLPALDSCISLQPPSFFSIAVHEIIHDAMKQLDWNATFVALGI